MLRPALLGLLFLLATLAGCSSGGTPSTGAEAGGTTAAPIAAGDGRLCIVAVDDAIRPIAGANVTVKLSDGSSRSAVSDESGKACIDLAPGSYIVEVRHIHQTYETAQTSAEVEAGKEAVVKVLMKRLFAQEPYHVTQKFDGFLQCAWAVEGAASSTCVNDYTHFVGLGYTCPECEHFFDNRGTTYPLDAGWQTQVYEVTWEPSAQGTSPEMRITVSHFPRPASHWYCSGTGATPILLRIELGEVCDDQQSEPTLQPPEGELNTTLFMAAKAPDGQPVAFAASQRFTVFMNFFYFGKPPPDWSFIQGGGEFPF
ncbi:MAG: hypothetical protein QOJ26_135 [Thermoplasmata archaeon]|jgi:hypothetical protein|nr:hypothetical protein [Thermoplasmata archaeon]MEA3165291.1 hypothetical protein [Thermoplasmata archaeon]